MSEAAASPPPPSHPHTPLRARLKEAKKLSQRGHHFRWKEEEEGQRVGREQVELTTGITVGE